MGMQVKSGHAALAPAQARQLFRDEEWSRPTRGFSMGYGQCGFVALPASYAYDFLVFCQRNPKILSVVEIVDTGKWTPVQSAPGADLRTDIPRYRVFEDGRLVDEPTNVVDRWRDDLVCVLLGCSLTFDRVFIANGLAYRQYEDASGPTIYRTNVDCVGAGPFASKMLVSMRPMMPQQVARAVQVTGRFPNCHGAPIHIGSPEGLGIADLTSPDVGGRIAIREGEVPVFWACVATVWEMAANVKAPIMITHAPGCMFVTDMPEEHFSLL